MSKVLVTGGAGFIGSHLAEGLVEAGYHVTVLDDLSTGKESNLDSVKNSVRFIKGSILDKDLLNKICSEVEQVYHLAAHTSVQKSIIEPFESHELNCTGTLNILEAAKQYKLRVVYASTSAYYGDSENLPFTESLSPNPISPYAAQKILGEHYARAYHEIHGVDFVGLRFFNVYGPRQASNGGYSGVITIFVEQMAAGKPITIFGDGEQTRDFIYVKDIVKACMTAMASPIKLGFYNIGTGLETSVNTIAKTMLAHLQKEYPIEYRPARTGDPLRGVADITLASTELGFKAQMPIQQGVASTLDAMLHLLGK